MKRFFTASDEEILAGGTTDLGVDWFGMETCLSNAPTIDFAMDIGEKDGMPVGKRGKFSARKHLFRCRNYLEFEVALSDSEVPLCGCGEKMEPALIELMRNGRRLKLPRSEKEIRASVIEQLGIVED
ncbi:MAG TPA: hypothetical protein VMB46_10035 [Methanomassiliicoccales archaeon]|nr:hypothetical protein [Methanomassiliicoccales archaeon]